ncbi:TMV resistance protein N-like isoform X2 [Quercus robur]|uniref:TMV resistance protein N-like isoform X2 n=1 Tax=Quercus robur TaxID=38942 RepID=UPI002161678B|nr:TMV resistance protein N-like isoform X2 [Quercus robur]
METDSLSFPSSYSTTARRKKYDVFLSFRGEDTRNNFMGHLYEALIQKGIVTFKDDEKLERGKPISPELSKAIEESEFAIVILSENYASSTWCLDELAKIIHCKNEMGITVLPVFHYVDPSDVRKQWGTFAQAFAKHEEKENKERVEKWRDALRQVANLRGWHLEDTWPEIEDIKDIVEWISLNLKYDAFPYIAKKLVGIYPRVMKLKSCLALGSYDVRFIGIWAMGGMGKTTLARVVYNMISKKFEDCVFIEDVREKIEKYGVVPLQEKIIKVLKEKDTKIQEKYDGVCKIYNRLCKKKILLVLDDVDKLKHLEMLAGEHDWFGSGSRIIITTRDKHVLEAHGVDEIYEVKGLCHEDSLQLFSLKAFKEKHVPNDYLKLSNHFLSYAANLPLALEVLGSFLIGRSLDEWNSVLKRLKQYPEEDIFQVLKISFDGLQKPQKEIFLHIACFFNHHKKDYVVEKLNILGLYPGIGLKELIDKSLLKIINEDIVWMHDLLEEMGRSIVSQEYPDDPGKRSRLWCYEDIDKVLRKNKGTEAIQAMVIWDTYDKAQMAHWKPEAFSNMYNLKFLRMNDVAYVPTHLPDDLRILDWISYSSKSLPSSFQSDELVQLCLQKSRIEQLWIGIKKFEKLKFIDLTASSYLIITPDFTEVPNLEKLVLERCINLHKFHPSISILKKLIHLNLKGCERLNPPSCTFESECLVALELSNCSNLKKSPIFVGNMEFLQKPFLDRTAVVELIRNFPQNLRIVNGLENLDLSYTAIEELPSSIVHLRELTSLTLRYCINLVHLSSTICSLKLLNSLDLFGCLKLDNLPEEIGNMQLLELLNLSWTAIKEVPSSIVRLKNLKQLHIRGWKLSEFYARPASPEWNDPLQTALFSLPTSPAPWNILLPSFLYYSLPTRPVPLGLLLPSLSGLQSLTYLHLSDCDLLSIPNDFGCLSSLAHLNLSGNNFVSLPKSISQLSKLQTLLLEGCRRLQSLESVPPTIDSVIANNCTSLERFLELQFHLLTSNHSHLNFQCLNCFKLVDNIQSISNMIQGQSVKLPCILDIIIPGGEIPKGFSPVGWCDNIQVPNCEYQYLMGITLCIVFVLNPWRPFSRDFQLTCLFEVNGFAMRYPVRSFFKLNYAMAESPHLWLLYLPPQCGEFSIKIISDNIKVMKKGFNLVYKQHAL